MQAENYIYAIFTYIMNVISLFSYLLKHLGGVRLLALVCNVVAIETTFASSDTFCCLVVTTVEKVNNCNYNHLHTCSNCSCEKKCVRHFSSSLCQQ